MYEKAIQNYEEVEEKNAEKFDEEPTIHLTVADHMFKADPIKTVTPFFTLNDNNAKRLVNY